MNDRIDHEAHMGLRYLARRCADDMQGRGRVRLHPNMRRGVVQALAALAAMQRDIEALTARVGQLTSRGFVVVDEVAEVPPEVWEALSRRDAAPAPPAPGDGANPSRGDG